MASAGRGGAIFSTNTGMNANNQYRTNVTINNSKFENNVANRGGTIFLMHLIVI